MAEKTKTKHNPLAWVKKHKKLTALLAVLLAVGIAIAAVRGKARQAGGTAYQYVRTTVLSKTTLSDSVSVNGTVKSGSSASVTAADAVKTYKVTAVNVAVGDTVRKGDIIATMTGSTKTLLKGERTALNILQHMSGIATATSRCVELVEGTRAQITDTRKTLPGLRPLQKYAVTVGGGKNHRYNLSDGAMLKDNHIDAYGGITPAVQALRAKIGHMVKIEVEVRTLTELEEALSAGADIIMLDNMSCEEMTRAVQLVNGRVPLEASGNVTEATIRSIAETGVDIISLGALTHSVKCFDISMRISTKQ